MKESETSGGAGAYPAPPVGPVGKRGDGGAMNAMVGWVLVLAWVLSVVDAAVWYVLGYSPLGRGVVECVLWMLRQR